MIRTALLSKWHVHADDYAGQAKENPNVSIDVVWDEVPERGKKWAGELGVPFVENLDTVLGDPAIEGVIVDTPTNLHKEIMIKAANQGKHIFTEKVLALTVEDCKEIFAAVEAADVKLMVSLPRLTESYYLYAQKILDDGLLGDLTTIRCRLAHNGAVPSENSPAGWLPEHFFNYDQCGGGAFIDLGAHPIYLSNRLAGPAVSVTGRLSSYLNRGVDDNAVVLVEYESGALGVLESGFVSSGSPFSLELYGTKGSLLIEEKEIRLKSVEIEEGDWITPNDVPESLAMPLNQWVNEIEHNRQPTITYQDFLGLTQINEAAAISSREGRKIKVKDD